jgi:hypothetical protein
MATKPSSPAEAVTYRIVARFGDLAPMESVCGSSGGASGLVIGFLADVVRAALCGSRRPLRYDLIVYRIEPDGTETRVYALASAAHVGDEYLILRADLERMEEIAKMATEPTDAEPSASAPRERPNLNMEPCPPCPGRDECPGGDECDLRCWEGDAPAEAAPEQLGMFADEETGGQAQTASFRR